MVDVSLAGLLMDGATVDSDGVTWNVEEVDGWDSAPTKSSDDELPGRHGGFGGPRLFASRLLTVKGWADCPTLAEAFAARDRLPLLTSGDLIVFEPVPRMLSTVSRGGVRATDPLEGGSCWFRFEIPLVSHDPFKRLPDAESVAVAAGATVAHTAAGTQAAEIEVTLMSGGTVDLTIAGLRLRTDALPAGAVLTSGPGFDNPKRTIRSASGDNLFGLIVQPMQWPAISPGANSLVNNGTADLSVRYFPTYA